jgi:hypothetical protein
MRQSINKPTRGKARRPSANQRNTLPDKEEAIVAVAQRTEGRNSCFVFSVRLIGRRFRRHLHEIDQVE